MTSLMYGVTNVRHKSNIPLFSLP